MTYQEQELIELGFAIQTALSECKKWLRNAPYYGVRINFDLDFENRDAKKTFAEDFTKILSEIMPAKLLYKEDMFFVFNAEHKSHNEATEIISRYGEVLPLVTLADESANEHGILS